MDEGTHSEEGLSSMTSERSTPSIVSCFNRILMGYSYFPNQAYRCLSKESPIVVIARVEWNRSTRSLLYDITSGVGTVNTLIQIDGLLPINISPMLHRRVVSEIIPVLCGSVSMPHRTRLYRKRMLKRHGSLTSWHAGHRRKS